MQSKATEPQIAAALRAAVASATASVGPATALAAPVDLYGTATPHVPVAAPTSSSLQAGLHTTARPSGAAAPLSRSLSAASQASPEDASLVPCSDLLGGLYQKLSDAQQNALWPTLRQVFGGIYGPRLCNLLAACLFKKAPLATTPLPLTYDQAAALLWVGLRWQLTNMQETALVNLLKSFKTIPYLSCMALCARLEQLAARRHLALAASPALSAAQQAMYRWDCLELQLLIQHTQAVPVATLQARLQRRLTNVKLQEVEVQALWEAVALPQARQALAAGQPLSGGPEALEVAPRDRLNILKLSLGCRSDHPQDAASLYRWANIVLMHVAQLQRPAGRAALQRAKLPQAAPQAIDAAPTLNAAAQQILDVLFSPTLSRKMLQHSVAATRLVLQRIGEEALLSREEMRLFQQLAQQVGCDPKQISWFRTQIIEQAEARQERQRAQAAQQYQQYRQAAFAAPTAFVQTLSKWVAPHAARLLYENSLYGSMLYSTMSADMTVLQLGLGEAERLSASKAAQIAPFLRQAVQTIKHRLQLELQHLQQQADAFAGSLDLRRLAWLCDDWYMAAELLLNTALQQYSKTTLAKPTLAKLTLRLTTLEKINVLQAALWQLSFRAARSRDYYVALTRRRFEPRSKPTLWQAVVGEKPPRPRRDPDADAGDNAV